MKPINIIREEATRHPEKIWLKQDDTSVTIFLPDKELVDPSLTISLVRITATGNMSAKIVWYTDLGKYPKVTDWRSRVRDVLPILKERINLAING